MDTIYGPARVAASDLVKNEASLCRAGDQKAEEPRSLFSLTFACGSRSMPRCLLGCVQNRSSQRRGTRWQNAREPIRPSDTFRKYTAQGKLHQLLIVKHLNSSHAPFLQNNYGRNRFAPLEEQNSLSRKSLASVLTTPYTRTHTETMTFTGD